MIDAAATLNAMGLFPAGWAALPGYARLARLRAAGVPGDPRAAMAAIDAHIADHPDVGLADPRGDALRLLGGVAAVAAALGATAWVLRRRALRANPSSIPLPGETDVVPSRPSKWDDPSTSDEFDAERDVRWLAETKDKYLRIWGQIAAELSAEAKAVGATLREQDMPAFYDVATKLARSTLASRYMVALTAAMDPKLSLWASPRAKTSFYGGKVTSSSLTGAELRTDLEKRASLAERYFRAKAALFRRSHVIAARGMADAFAVFDPRLAVLEQDAIAASNHMFAASYAFDQGDYVTGRKELHVGLNLLGKALQGFGMGDPGDPNCDDSVPHDTLRAMYGERITLSEWAQLASQMEKRATAKAPGKYADTNLASLEESEAAGELSELGEMELAKLRVKELRRLARIEAKNKATSAEIDELTRLRGLVPAKDWGK